MLLAIGEALIDFIPDKTGCAFREVTGFSPAVGGAPANVCGAFAKLGGKARLLTQLGDDPFGHKILEELAEHGIDVSCIPLTDRANTALAFVSLAPDGNRTFSFYRNPSADLLLEAEQLEEGWFHGMYALHFCSVCLGEYPMRAAHIRAIELARQQGGIISFDPNLRFPLWKDPEALRKAVRDFLPLADVVKISDEELEFITGEREIERALPKLLRGNVKLVVYTCGKDGAHAFTRTIGAYQPAVTMQAVDTTGAGDGFIGAFLWKLQQYGVDVQTLAAVGGDVLEDCLRFSNRFAGISVASHGAIPSYPTLEEMSE